MRLSKQSNEAMQKMRLLLIMSLWFPLALFGSVVPGQVSRDPVESASRAASPPNLVLTVVNAYERPVITVDSPGAQGVRYGFEGGRAIKIGKTYHLFTTEESGDPRFVKTKLGYWMSRDRIHWKRVSTLYESTADMSGSDVRASLWAPMPVYDHKNGRWELFYVGYRAEPENSPYPPKSDPQDRNPYLEIPANPNPGIFYNYGGSIWRAVSQTRGPHGIGGPYKDAGIILKPGPESEFWEGIQGTDSFFPYQVEGKWYGFYGSRHCETLPVKAWQVGLASAPDLSGPWTRVAELNPVAIDRRFVENPVVAQLEDGRYIAVYNGPKRDSIGYTSSSDGIHWGQGANLVIQAKEGAHWADPVRTPLGLIPEGNNTFTLFYTGYLKGGNGDVFRDPISEAIGFATVRVEPSIAK
jgi:hypothetical protein